MKPNSYSILRLLAVLLTVGVIAAHQYLPPKVLKLYPDPERLSFIFGPEHQGAPSADWIDRDNGHYWCNYAPGDIFSCGWSVNLGLDRITGIDLSDYDGFNVLIHYKGNSPRLRFFLRNFDPAYSDVETFDISSKVMATTISTSDLNELTYIPLNEFSVAEWWITQFDIPRQYSGPSANNVIVFGVDFNVHSTNEVRIERIEAVGSWIKKESLYFLIIAAWMSLVIGEVIWRFYLVHQKARADAQRLNRLSSEYKKLEIEKQEFEALSTTDVLTGVMNRAGVQQFLQKLFESNVNWRHMGVLIFDIDHFKKFNDQYGHDVGDLVLNQVAKVISQNIRQTDIFGRWGGEEFILICPQIPEERLRSLADKLRESIEQHVFDAQGQPLRVTVSVGATTVDAKESFETVFKRADIALYKAKNNGRNQVQFEQP
jgi:diguanylate cyclase (GGDEF)-like protein